MVFSFCQNINKKKQGQVKYEKDMIKLLIDCFFGYALKFEAHYKVNLLNHYVPQRTKNNILQIHMPFSV